MHSSRKPRRAFAAPLVVTAAALPACVFASSSGPAPTHVTTADHRTADGGGPPVITDPPRPGGAGDPTSGADTAIDETHPAGDPPGYQRNWTVYLQDDGSCVAALDVACKPHAICNPPAPTAVACPTGITVDAPVKIFGQSGSWDCFVTPAPTTCPEHATCNPPPPRQTACPK